MFERLRNLVASTRELVSSLDLQDVDGNGAVELVDFFAELERLAAAGRTIAGRRVVQTRAWYGSGYPSPAKWMAARAQTTLGVAVATIETGQRLDSLPATRSAFVSGELSAQQAQHITAAAAVHPAAEATLLDAAQKDSVNSLRLQCEQVIAAGSTDTDEDERRHRSRSFRMWLQDGMIRVEGRFTTDAGAKLKTVVDARTDLFVRQARAAGSRERREAYAADALVAVADASTPGPKAVVNVLVDYAAIQRGHLENGDRCAVPGIGPVSLAATKRLAEEGVIKLILTDEADVRGVVSLGRTVTAKQRAALEVRDPTCVVPGCDEAENLEIHHFGEPFVKSRRTKLNEICHACHWHHLLATHCGWRIVGGPGRWEFLPPDRSSVPLPDP